MLSGNNETNSEEKKQSITSFAGAQAGTPRGSVRAGHSGPAPRGAPRWPAAKRRLLFLARRQLPTRGGGDRGAAASRPRRLAVFPIHGGSSSGSVSTSAAWHWNQRDLR